VLRSWNCVTTSSSVKESLRTLSPQLLKKHLDPEVSPQHPYLKWLRT
jgi:hypothetical protein